ncbi:MAG: 3-phosphoshikimate 1-carboxyvinyltransferase [Bacilli bacterium]|nr:3-phosphoshikimate 1-carboxyvinyltransferase [Bacilli bacterium]
MKAVIQPSLARGHVAAPPSKSYGHRLLIASFLAKGGSITHLGTSKDIQATQDCLKALSEKANPLVLPCQESGSTLRFMIPIALLQENEVIFTGSNRLFQRGLTPYFKIFDEQGVSYSLEVEKLTVQGKLKPGLFRLEGGVSSQFITGLMFALPLLEGDSTLQIDGALESAPYVAMTIDVLSRFGVIVHRLDQGFFIPGKQVYKPIDAVVEGDESNAAFLHALNLLGGHVEVEGLNPNTIQGDKVHLEFFEKLRDGHPVIDLSNAIDLGPICFGMAALLHGATFTNIRRLRIKESDRVADMAEICRLFGAKTVEEENRIEIYPSTEKGPLGEIKVPNDHRLVMTTAVMLTTRGGTILGAEAVNKSYPNFFDDLRRLGVEVSLYEE